MSFAGMVTILVVVQLIESVALANLVHRRDQPPQFLVTPFEGTLLGKLLCLVDAPLIGQVRQWIKFKVYYF